MNTPYASVSDASGNTYITGVGSNAESTQGDFVTIKVDPTGTLIWETRQSGSLYAVEYGVQIHLDAIGNPVATGVGWNGSDMDVYTIKYEQATGVEIWSTTFDSGNSTLDIPTAMDISPTGDIVIGGITYTGASMEYLVLKYNASGQLLWSAADSNPIASSWNEPSAIAVNESGVVAITGYAAVDGDSQGYWEGYLTLLYDSEGKQVWRRPFLFQSLVDETDPSSGLNNTHSAAKSIAFDANGNLIVTGTFDVINAPRMGTIKYDSDGNEEWIKTYRAGEFKDDYTNGHSIKIAGKDKIYVVGRHTAGWINEGLVLISYADDGQENWTDENQNIIQIQTAKMILDEDNLPVIAGLGYDDGTQDLRVRVFKYSENGTILNETSYLKMFSATESIKNLIGLSVDNNDNVYLTLDNYYTSKGGVFETVRIPFDSDPNNPDWTAVLETPLSSSNTRMLNSTVDSENNTYVTGDFGVIENNQFIMNYFVAQYNEAGEVQWEKNFSPQDGIEPGGIVVKVDTDDNLIVFLLPNPYTVLPLRINKYTPSGDLIWEIEKEVHSALFSAFFLDDDNNIYVSGSAKENDSDDFPVFATLKYNAEGEEEWAQFNTTGQPDDFVFEINAGEVTSDGAVILTGVSGYSSMFAQVVDLTVIKYNSAGNLEWLNKYPQPDFGSNGVDLLTDQDNNIYVCGRQVEPLMQVEELLALKIDPDGEVLWTTSYGQSDEGRRINPYKIMQNSLGNLIIPSYSLYWVAGEPSNNRINSIELDQQTGEIVWENNSEIGRYYKDAYIDGDNTLFILGQTQEVTYKRLGTNTIASLLKINSVGQTIEELDFAGPALSDYNPSNITPLNNGSLLLGGTLYNIDFYSGIYFFESSHIVLGTSEHGFEHPNVSNWLGQNFPNPVQDQTTIPFFLKNGGKTSIIIYDSTGKSVYSIMDKNFSAGNHKININLDQLDRGIYYYQIKNGTYKTAKRLLKQ
ncbi:hypothetical protein GCM10011506_18410 [Marivirga lumbricoides]|uniref:Secretion system C-terminal sorting domain-containing protein n=2 Tax=Marivirga lumbricoides TaxID=1046115 RepID=A0ABQ1M1L1_9BACT|nr:hypothetical protein GCM10011506_18410 [Marivirga lumbricoides]